jgi:hypothetical protein
MNPWLPEQAQEWYAAQPWLVGCNFLPSTVINQVEMLQADTFDPVTIWRELGWARDLGFNTLRVYLHDILWKEEAREGFLASFDEAHWTHWTHWVAHWGQGKSEHYLP